VQLQKLKLEPVFRFQNWRIYIPWLSTRVIAATTAGKSVLCSARGAAAKGEASRGGGGGSSSRGDGDGCAWGFAFLKTFGGETPHDIASK
jgi:hypothetical protein